MSLFLSIITATYNAAGILPQLLDSLVSQTCQDFEVIIQDGGSEDKTAAIVATYTDRLDLIWNSEPDNGIYDAWNKALPRIRGEWVLFLGADDKLYGEEVVAKTRCCIHEAKLARHVDEELLFASGGVVVTSAEGTPLRYISGRGDGSVASLRTMAIPVPFPGLFIHSSLLNGRAFNASLRIAGDFEFLCRTWTHDASGIRLPYLVTSMRCGGLSDRPEHDAVTFREITDAVQKYYGTAWTDARRRLYRKTQLISWLWRYFPGFAEKLQACVRAVRKKGRRVTDIASAKLPGFSPETVPVFIVSFNRLRYLKQLVTWLERNGFSNIIIVDNNSTYEPLVKYLASLPHRVVMLQENLGHLAVWKCGQFAKILKNEYFIVTDPDVLPIADCPEDAVMHMYTCLMAYPQITKCGFSLLIDDLPSEHPMRETVLGVEKPYWEHPLPDGSGYFALIDTTFALYRPGIAPEAPEWFEGIRLAPPYAARHCPWYDDPDSTEDEAVFYRNNIQVRSSFWSASDTESLKRENFVLRARVGELEQQVDLLSRSFGGRITLLSYKVMRALRKGLARK